MLSFIKKVQKNNQIVFKLLDYLKYSNKKSPSFVSHKHIASNILQNGIIDI